MAAQYVADGDLRFASTLSNHCVFADQTNDTARSALASVFQTLGWGAENATWRNFYLTGAKGLTGEIAPALNSIAPDPFLALNMEQLFNTLAIRINRPKASIAILTIDFQVEDIETGWHLNMSNSVLTYHSIPFKDHTNLPDSSTDLTVWTSH